MVADKHSTVAERHAVAAWASSLLLSWMAVWPYVDYANTFEEIGNRGIPGSWTELHRRSGKVRCNQQGTWIRS